MNEFEKVLLQLILEEYLAKTGCTDVSSQSSFDLSTWYDVTGSPSKGRLYEFGSNSSSTSASSTPLCSLLISSIIECSSGVYPSHHSIEELSATIFYGSLGDVGFKGSPYTWTDHRLWQRLDRVIFSNELLDAFPSTSIRHLPRSSSDHCPILVSVRLPTKSGTNNRIGLFVPKGGGEVDRGRPKRQVFSNPWAMSPSRIQSKLNKGVDFFRALLTANGHPSELALTDYIPRLLMPTHVADLCWP
ncbi:hypothetical protein Salat_1690700 [Sesamum alatum]|uniref:Endonuclease/exonuclease/phosphatase domain-containing protein n=1 Tax=Sesamum alatum TaxID=300844 RepID=A0AAE2CJZ7_9LAMI|nr:hypothetical protein Salat_1690700 [Sesamum alatum]